MTSRGAILVTGAAGFLGRHVAEHLLSAGRPVRGLVRPGSRPLPQGVTPALAAGIHAPILRLPLVYGPGVRANFLRLMELGARGARAVENRRTVPPAVFTAAARIGDVIARAVPFPIPTAEVERLIGSLTVDSSRFGRVTGFRPPYSMDAGLLRTADWFHGRRRRG